MSNYLVVIKIFVIVELKQEIQLPFLTKVLPIELM